MKQSEALEHLREMIWALQRYRSIAMEELGPNPDYPLGEQLCITEELAAKMWPWIFGEECPLPALVKIVDDAETSGTLAPTDYYSMMFILDRFMPEVKICLHNWRGVYTVPEEPPSLDILAGWEEE